MNILLQAIATLSTSEQAIVRELLAKDKQNLKAINTANVEFGTVYMQNLIERY